LVKLQHSPRVGLAQYGTVIVQWYSHERRLPGSMIDDEFEVCFGLSSCSLSSASSHACKTPHVEGAIAGYLRVPYPGGAKNKKSLRLHLVSIRKRKAQILKKYSRFPYFRRFFRLQLRMRVAKWGVRYRYVGTFEGVGKKGGMVTFS
jgi:hypothetical protein